MSIKNKRMDAIGLIETSSIARGYEIQDTMLKAADVTLMVARKICYGKNMIVVAGEVSAVEAATHAGSEKARGVLIEDLLIPNLHPDVFTAIGGSINLEEEDPSDLGFYKTINLVKKTKQTSFSDLMRMRLNGKKRKYMEI